MAAIEFGGDATFDPAVFAEFLTAQRDLGTKWAPRFVRVARAIPLTANNKVNKQPLRAEAWRDHGDPVWWRPGRELTYRPLTDADRAALTAEASQYRPGA
jgi:fatty-acyl-CoA synthase